MSAEALDLLSDNFDALTNWLDGMGEVVADFDDESAGIVRVQLDDLLTKVRGAIGAVDQRLIGLLGVGQSLAIPGGGQVVVEARGKQSTQGAKLARRLAARVADTPADEDGVALPPAVLCEKTADELVTVFALDNASASFRSTEVKARGLKASEFREFADGEAKVRFLR